MTLIKSNAHRDISRHKNRNAGFFSKRFTQVIPEIKRDLFYFALRFSFDFSLVSRLPYSFISLMSSTFLERSFRKVSINCTLTCG